MSSARLESEPEFAALQGAEDFEYDPFVRHRRLAEKSMDVVMGRISSQPIGRSLVTDIRNRPHFARQTPDDLGIIPGNYPLRLVRMLLQFADLGVPYLALLMRESPVFNSRLVELWPRVTVPGVGYKNSICNHQVTALCVEPGALYFFDYKTVKALLRAPQLYTRTRGKWDSPRLRDAASRYGIDYRLVSDEDLGRYTVANLRHLSQTYAASYYAAPHRILVFMRDHLEQEGMIDCQDLYRAGIDRDAIRCLVARQLGYIPITEEDLTLEIHYLYASRCDYLVHRASRIAFGENGGAIGSSRRH